MRDEVHVWLLALDQSPPHVESLKAILSADERDRAGRFHFQKDHDHYVVARGTVRIILGRYLGMGADRLRFSYTYYGKPALEKEFGGESLRFNLSHSHGLALLAVTRDRELGVDIERIRAGISDEGIAERFFSDKEVRMLRGLPRELQDQAFFNCWTRKEAYIKARGEGLSMPLAVFDVSLIPGEPAALLETRLDPLESARWSLRELTAAPDFAAAIVVEGNDWDLICWRWQA
ncbi:MAG TPA: 4'-phosphopantetheinyl transferase superfamily protein [Blastocatellia bacterium]|nr:4'-phosphopantetheinyl transferase superfamily protein [Blastocatellia bacterium]